MKLHNFECFSLLHGSVWNLEFFYLPQNGAEQISEHFPFRKTDGIPLSSAE